MARNKNQRSGVRNQTQNQTKEVDMVSQFTNYLLEIKIPELQNEIIKSLITELNLSRRSRMAELSKLKESTYAELKKLGDESAMVEKYDNELNRPVA